MTYVDSILEEVELMTPKTGFNVCIFDDFGDVGEKLTVIGHFDSREEADDLVAEYDDDVTLYIYGSEKSEEKQLDVSQQKPHNIPAYIKKAKRDYEKGIHSDNDEYEDLNYHAHEEFVEQEHPRGQPDNAGQFVAKDEQTGDKPTQSETTRDRTFNRKIEKHEMYIERFDERIEEAEKELAKEQETGHTLKGIQLEMKINRMGKNRKDHQQSLDNAKEEIEKWSKLDLFEISDIGTNTHKVGSKGFKNGVTQATIGDWQLEFRGDRMDFLKERESGAGISEKQWDERFKGKTMIHSNITKNMDESIVELQDEIMYLWNDVLSDKQREGVDVLKIYYTANPKWKIRHGKKERTLGTHGGRKVMEYGEPNAEKDIMMSPSVLTINLTSTDTPDSVLNTMIHEVNHSMYDKNLKDDHEKINKFTEKVLAMGKEGAVTEYAGSYFDDLEDVKKEYEGKWEEEKDRLMNHHNYGQAEHQTDEEYKTWLDQNILNDVTRRKKSAEDDIRKNIAKVERLIANETHSEYFGMIGSPTSDDYHTSDTVKLKEVGELIKEHLYD